MLRIKEKKNLMIYIADKDCFFFFTVIMIFKIPLKILLDIDIKEEKITYSINFFNQKIRYFSKRTRLTLHQLRRLSTNFAFV